MKEQEEWRDVIGFVGYQISNKGRVRSYRKYKCGQVRGVDQIIDTPRIMSVTSDDGNGYLKVKLQKEGKGYSKKIHRLVAEAFVPNPDHLETVDHISNDKLDNRPENLRWVSRHENVSRAYSDNLHKEDISNRKKPVILRDKESGIECVFDSVQQAADFLCVHYTSISHAFRDGYPIRGYFVEILESERQIRQKEKRIKKSCVEG